MTTLPARDLCAALDFVAEAHSFETTDELRHGILPGLQRLLPCDLVGYNEVDPGGEALVLTYPWQVPAAVNLELPRLAHQHPLISVQLNGDFGTYKISDFLSARQFHALELYEGLYRQIGAEDQIAFGLSGPVVIGIAMNRDRRSFSARDRAMLELLRPHLAQAYAAVAERTRAETLIAALEQGLEEDATAVVALGRDGGVAAASDRASELLRAYFPGAGQAALPPAIVAWLEDRLPNRPPLTVDAERGQLIVSEAPPGIADGTVLVLEEKRVVTAESLRPLGLTRRQAKVLSLLVAGKSTSEIADALFISPRTVRKHLEHIYARLGVHSRAGAVAAARASLR